MRAGSAAIPSMWTAVQSSELWRRSTTATLRGNLLVAQSAGRSSAKRECKKMAKTTEQANKALVREAFDTLFNKRDYQAAERFWSPNYIQHSAHIKPGRDGLFDLIRSSPAALRYEPGTIVAEGDYVIVHGRFSNTGGPMDWIAADVVRVADDVLPEHGALLQGAAP